MVVEAQAAILICTNRQAHASAPLAIARTVFCKELRMNYILSPFLADYIWVGGGSLGLIVVIVLIVLLLRK
jgi:hypothetical protein